jgi:hypothetical protein
MAKLTFGQEAIQNIINQGRTEVGIVNTIKDASDSEKLNAAIAGADTLQAAISLFKNIPAIGIGVNYDKLIYTFKSVFFISYP